MVNATLNPAPRQRSKVARLRTVRLTTTDAGTSALVIRQKQGNQAEQVDAYFLEPIPSQMGGRGLILHKHDGTSYCVRLDGSDSSCDCKGFTRYSHCKHVESLLELQQR